MLLNKITSKYLVAGYVCKCCNSTFKTKDQLRNHLTHIEGMSEITYFNNYIKPNNPMEGICLSCGKPTNFIDCVSGYEDYCSTKCENNNLNTLANTDKKMEKIIISILK